MRSDGVEMSQDRSTKQRTHRQPGGRARLRAAGSRTPQAAGQGSHQDEAPIVLVGFDDSDTVLVFAATDTELTGLTGVGLTQLLAAPDVRLPGAANHQLAQTLVNLTAPLNVIGQATHSVLTLQGLYRLGPQTKALMANGADFMRGGGLRLGTLVKSGTIVKPVQLIPAAGAGLTGILAGVGPALVLLGMQLQLGRITRLVEGLYPIALEAVTEIRAGRWSAVTAGRDAVQSHLNVALEVGQPLDEMMTAAHHAGHELRVATQACHDELARWSAEWRSLTTATDRQRWMTTTGRHVPVTIAAAMQGRLGIAVYEYLHAWHLLGIRPTTDELSPSPTDEARVRAGRSYLRQAVERDTQFLDSMAELTDLIHRGFGRIAEVSIARYGLTAEHRALRHVAEQARTVAHVMLEAGLAAPVAEPVPVVAAGAMDPQDRSAAIRMLRWDLEDGERLLAIFRCAPFTRDPFFPATGTLVVTDRRLIAHDGEDLAKGKEPIWACELARVHAVASEPRSGGGGWVRFKLRHAKPGAVCVECRAEDRHDTYTQIAAVTLDAARASQNTRPAIEA